MSYLYGNTVISKFMNHSVVNKYHLSYSLLMDVIDKIESSMVESKEDVRFNGDMEDIELYFTVEISGPQCMVHSDMLPQYYGTNQDFLKLYDCRKRSKIKSMWLAVVEFIKWYNKNK